MALPIQSQIPLQPNIVIDAAPTYPDLYLPDTMKTRLSEIKYRTAEHLTPGGTLAAIVKMNNLSVIYSTYSYVGDERNGKIHKITISG